VSQPTRRKASGSTTMGTSVADLFDERREERLAAARAEREQRNYEFRVDQAAKAKTFERLTGLKPGSVAQRFAEAVIDCFPSAVPTAEQSRTQRAELEALDKMSDVDVSRDKAMNLGRSVARAALRWAYQELNKS